MKEKKEVIKVSGQSREIITLRDDAGKLIDRFIRPLMLEFKPRDVLQIAIGAAILAIPVGFTEETWVLAAELPAINIWGFVIISLALISTFVYYNYYRNQGIEHYKEFIKRVLSTYITAFIVVALLLTLINKAPWSTDWMLSLKRIALVTFPASMSGTIADVIK